MSCALSVEVVFGTSIGADADVDASSSQGGVEVPATGVATGALVSAVAVVLAVAPAGAAATGSSSLFSSIAADPTGTALLVVAAVVVADQILSDPDKKNIKDFVTNPTDTVARAFGW